MCALRKGLFLCYLFYIIGNFKNFLLYKIPPGDRRGADKDVIAAQTRLAESSQANSLLLGKITELRIEILLLHKHAWRRVRRSIFLIYCILKNILTRDIKNAILLHGCKKPLPKTAGAVWHKEENACRGRTILNKNESASLSKQRGFLFV